MQTWKAIIHLIEMNIKVFLFTRKMLGVWLSREVYILYTHTHIYIYIYIYIYVQTYTSVEAYESIGIPYMLDTI